MINFSLVEVKFHTERERQKSRKRVLREATVGKLVVENSKFLDPETGQLTA